MGNSDEMNERIGGCDPRSVRFGAQRVTVNDLASRRNARFRARANEGAHAMSAAEQFGGEAGAEEASGAGEEDLSWRHGDLPTDTNTEPERQRICVLPQGYAQGLGQIRMSELKSACQKFRRLHAGRGQ